MRLERQLVPLLGLLADREQPDGRLADLEQLLREHDAHVRELDEVLGARVGVRAGVDQDRRAAARRDHDRDPGRWTPGRRRTWSSDAARIAPVFPGRDDCIRLPVADGADSTHERRVGLPAHRLGGLLAHPDRLGADDELEALWSRSAGPNRTAAACRTRRRLRPHDLVRCVVAAEGVDRDTNRHVRSRYGAGARSGEISRPRYVLHVGQTRCDYFGDPHCSQVETRGAEMACCARRLSRRDAEVFRFGTAMSGRQCSELAHATPGRSECGRGARGVGWLSGASSRLPVCLSARRVRRSRGGPGTCCARCRLWPSSPFSVPSRLCGSVDWGRPDLELDEAHGPRRGDRLEEAPVVRHDHEACRRSPPAPARAARPPRGRGGWSARRGRAG